MDIIKLASISIQEYKKLYENLSQLGSNLRNVIVTIIHKLNLYKCKIQAFKMRHPNIYR